MVLMVEYTVVTGPKDVNTALGCRDGVMVRALASHQCGRGSFPRLGVICGLSLLVLYSAPRGFSPGIPVFPSPQKPTVDLICVDLSLQCYEEKATVINFVLAT